MSDLLGLMGAPRTYQLLAWALAYLVALFLYRASAARGGRRFVLGLGLGVVLGHVGWALVHLPHVLEQPEAILLPGAVSVLFVPLGVLLMAPWREALAALPLALAVARLGCLPFRCCYEVPSHALLEIGGLVAIHVLARRRPKDAPFLVLSGFGLLRLLSTPLRVPLHPEPFVDPAWFAGLWVVAGIALRGSLGSAGGAREWFPERAEPLLRTLLLVLIVWLLFPLATSMSPDGSIPTAAACAVATVLVVALRTGRSTPRLAPGLAALGIGLAAGILVSGLARSVFGAAPALATGSQDPDALGWIATVLLAPVFQEILYRERLLLELEALFGASIAVLLSSAVFAVSHIDPAAMAVPFGGGIAAGALMLHTRSLPLVVGLHVGWNARLLAGG